MTGLTNEEVQERIAQGQVNNNENPNTRTYKQIILENTLTFFNFLNLVLLVLVLLVGSYKNSMFVGIIFINTVIGIIQEVRAKKTIDKLAILTESKTVVLREGKKWKISTEKLVVDDLIFLKAGEQVVVTSRCEFETAEFIRSIFPAHLFHRREPGELIHRVFNPLVVAAKGQLIDQLSSGARSKHLFLQPGQRLAQTQRRVFPHSAAEDAALQHPAVPGQEGTGEKGAHAVAHQKDRQAGISA